MYNKTEQLPSKEPRLHWSTRLVLAFSVLSLILASCTPAEATESQGIPLESPEFTPATLPLTPTAHPTETPVSTEVPEYLPPSVFEIGHENPISLDQPLTITVPLDTAVALTWGIEKSFPMTLSEFSTGPIWDRAQIEAFNANGENNSEGNMILWFPTSDPHHFIGIVHSGNRSSIGKAVYLAGYIESIGQTADLYGKTSQFTFADAELSGTIVRAANIPTDIFYAPGNLFADNLTTPMYLRLAQLGFPEDLLSSPNNVYRLTFVACQDEVPGKPSLQETLSTMDASANQSLLTYEFSLP